MNGSFRSVMAPFMASYLSLKQALGRRYTVERSIFAHLDAFLVGVGSDLTPETFQKWIETRLGLTSGVRRKWMHVVRNLCLYRRRTDTGCFVPDSSQFPARHQTITPYIFREIEIAQLLGETSRLRATSGSPLRPQNALLGIVLLYTAGLRRGELLRLTVGDYDPSEGTILIRESKFHKSRLLPLSTDAVQTINKAFCERQVNRVPRDNDAPLLWSRQSPTGAYTGTGFRRIVGQLLRRCAIQTPAGSLPRVHDFRHTFAVHALLRWYRTGVDMQSKLPALATYMGHVSIASTQYYLPFVEELAAVASDRFERRYGAMVHTPQTPVEQRAQS